MAFDPTRLLRDRAAQKAFNAETVTRAEKEIGGIGLFGKVSRTTMGRMHEGFTALKRDAATHGESPLVRLFNDLKEMFGNSRGS